MRRGANRPLFSHKMFLGARSCGKSRARVVRERERAAGGGESGLRCDRAALKLGNFVHPIEEASRSFFTRE